MNLIERVARMLDREGAYSEWNDAASGKKIEFTVRQKYFQSVYERLAVDVMKVALGHRPAEIRKALIEFEKEGWRGLGVPIDDPKIKAVAHRTIEEKYSNPA